MRDDRPLLDMEAVRVLSGKPRPKLVRMLRDELKQSIDDIKAEGFPTTRDGIAMAIITYRNRKDIKGLSDEEFRMLKDPDYFKKLSNMDTESEPIPDDPIERISLTLSKIHTELLRIANIMEPAIVEED